MCTLRNYTVQFELFDSQHEALSGQIALEDVFKAYFECRRLKRRTASALAFELDFERELVRLWREINSGAYKIGRSIAFIVRHPVQREVFAADFRDRIVHHLVVSKLNPLFEREFIFDSYSCREGKGTQQGVKRIRSQIEECSDLYTRDCYIMKLDIRSFFMSIDKNVLYRMLAEFIGEKYHCSDKPILLRLVRQIIFNNPEENCIIKGRRSDWNGLPCHKSLFWSKRHCGLPIGNLTSQIFANFYLNRLDKYVVEELGIKYYGRYVDDFILIDSRKETLLEAHRKIKAFLQSSLKLELHPDKFYLQHCSKGVGFIGAVIRPGRVYIGARSKNNLYHKIQVQLRQMSKSVENTLAALPGFASIVNSYLGIMKHYNTYNLRSHILTMLDNTFLGEVTERDAHAAKLSIDRDFRPAGLKKRQLRKQRQYRRRQRHSLYKGENNGSI